jgi:acetylornithine deacetylase/succinyl-diaminopimelate desuccinylase-like protein
VRIDTTNPPGNELEAATLLQNVLSRDSLGSEVIEATSGRANWVALIEGQSHEGTTALVHHMDVVPAEAADWKKPPFGGEVEGDELWGRGAIDNKGAGILQLLSVVVPLRSGKRPAEDVLLVGVSDEEAGGGWGARWLLEQRPELFENVTGVLNEGGAIVELAPGRSIYSVEIAQKAPLWLRVTATGPAGHGSRPSSEVASHTLIRALSRLEAYQFPIHVVPEVQAVFAARSGAMPRDKQAAYRDLRRSLERKSFREEFLASHDGALVQNTLAITMLEASDKENVLSSSASAVLDLRLLPGENVDSVIKKVKEVMHEPNVQVETLLSWEAVAASTETPLFERIERLAARTHPEAPVVANVIGGFTDCNAFRAKGITCYGFLPMRIAPSSFALLHGTDERVSLPDLVDGTRNLAALLQMATPESVEAEPPP